MRRLSLLLSVLFTALVLAACGGGTTQDQEPEPEPATAAEAVETLNTLLADVTTAALGLQIGQSTSPFYEDPCYYQLGWYCDGEDLSQYSGQFPYEPYWFYVGDWDDVNYVVHNPRPAHGTVSLDWDAEAWVYSPEPANAFVNTYEDYSTGKVIETRIVQSDFTDLPVANYYQPFWETPVEEQPTAIKVPGKVQLTAKDGDVTRISIDIEQELRPTTCGYVPELAFFSVSGFLRFGAYSAEIPSVVMDHRTEGHIEVSAAIDLNAGSLHVPIDVEAVVDIEGFARDEFCMVDFEEVTGITIDADFSVGAESAAVAGSVGLKVVPVEDEGDTVTQVTLESLSLTFGGKTVGVSLGSSIFDTTLQFADQALTFQELVEQLDVPAFFLPFVL